MIILRNKWLLIICFFTLLLLFSTEVKAKPINNFDTAGDDNGPKGKGSASNYSINGDFGIRFSLVEKVRGTKIGRSIDYFKINDAVKNGEILHSKKGKNKIEYLKQGFKKDEFCKMKYLNNGGGYAYHESGLWNVIYSKFGKKASRKEIKKWMDGERQGKALANKMHVSYAQFRSDKNMVVIEPIFYFTLNRQHYALTAHEIALWDEHLGGAIRKKHVSRSHKNIPVSLFLKTGRFGFERYNGIVKTFDNKTIKEKLGIGLIGVRDEEVEKPPKITTFDYIYRCDTDVYTAVELSAQTDSTPDKPLKVDFAIPNVGDLEVDQIYVPKGYTQLVWIKWHTPKEPTELNIKVKSNKSEEKTIKVDIREKVLWEPKNPVAEDNRPTDLNKFQENFNPENAKLTEMEEVDKKRWSKWEIVEFQPRGDFKGWGAVPHFDYDDEGNSVITHYSYYAIWDEHAYWSFGKHEYTVETAPDGTSVSHIVNGRTPTEPTYYTAEIVKTKMLVKPAETCKQQNPNPKFIKSGYGVEADINLEIKGNGIHETTGFQTAKYFFPEFNYNKYWRIGERVEHDKILGGITDKISFPKNWYSYQGYHNYNNGRYHFLPIWYPDGKYVPYANVFDCWTPSGELRVKTKGEINCVGSLWEDWHVRIKN